jgi:hypothetical protein
MYMFNCTFATAAKSKDSGLLNESQLKLLECRILWEIPEDLLDPVGSLEITINSINYYLFDLTFGNLTNRVSSGTKIVIAALKKLKSDKEILEWLTDEHLLDNSMIPLKLLYTNPDQLYYRFLQRG